MSRICCAWCGEDLGGSSEVYNSGEPESCGRDECNRQVRAMAREATEEAQQRAAEDNWERYR